MKTLARFAAVVPLVAACGSATRVNSHAMDTECSYELAAGAGADALQRAVNDALEGRSDPCLGSVSGMAVRNVALQRINVATAGGVQRFSLVFSISSNQVDVSRNQVAVARSDFR